VRFWASVGVVSLTGCTVCGWALERLLKLIIQHCRAEMCAVVDYGNRVEQSVQAGTDRARGVGLRLGLLSFADESPRVGEWPAKTQEGP
jgi:hypothetical protein